MIKVGIAGAAGRMGRRLGALSFADDQLQIACAMERKGHADLGKDYGQLLGVATLGVTITETPSDDVDTIIDFTTPASTAQWVRAAADGKTAIVIGTTGLGDAEMDLIKKAGKTIPIVQAPNMSVGVNLLFSMLGQIAKSLGDDYDVEISETHHRFKKDAPSGTALGLLKAVCEGLGCDHEKVAVYGRHGLDAERKKGQIGVHALRLGDTVGEHTVSFGTLGETVSISHSAHSRDTFALGALRAVKWLAGKPAGVYTMKDVLFGQ